LDHQNNYVERLNVDNAKSFNIPATSSSFLHNYFNGSTKLFSDLYLTKFLLQQNRFFREEKRSKLCAMLK